MVHAKFALHHLFVCMLLCMYEKWWKKDVQQVKEEEDESGVVGRIISCCAFFAFLHWVKCNAVKKKSATKKLSLQISL